MLVFSEETYKRECIILNRRIEKEIKNQKKHWWYLSNKVFGCREDAQTLIDQDRKKLRYHPVHTTIEKVKKYSSPGCPKAESVAEVMGHQITYRLDLDQASIDQIRRSKGRFIFAANQLDSMELASTSIL